MYKHKPKKISLSINSIGHANLLVERDAGNEFLVLMGKKEYALPAWRRLRELCDQAIEYLEGMPDGD